MNHHSAYKELCIELESYRRMPFEELLRQVGGPPAARTLDTQDGPLTIEVSFAWAGSHEKAVRVRATAYGPSWWRLERLDEAVTVIPPSQSA